MEKIILPRSSYYELIKIVRAYAKQDKAVSLNEIGKLTGINHTIVSANNSFLASIGLIEGGKSKRQLH